MRRYTIADTTVELYEYVFPQYINPANTMFGGKMLFLISQAGSLSANKVAQGPVVMGSLDSVDFIEPVREGDILIFRSRVQYISRTSMEVGVTVWKQNPAEQEKRVVTVAHMAFVAIDAEGRPRPIDAVITPADEMEERIYRWGKMRREQRLKKIGDRKEQRKDVDVGKVPTYHLYSAKIVFPAEAFFSSIMFAGYLFEKIDELAAILARRYAGAPVVTASIDDVIFYSPLKVGDVAHFYLGINHVGRKSMEIGVKVLREEKYTGQLEKVSSSYISMVSTQPLIPFNPWQPHEKRRWHEAEERKKHRIERARKFRECIQKNVEEPICD